MDWIICVATKVPNIRPSVAGIRILGSTSRLRLKDLVEFEANCTSPCTGTITRKSRKNVIRLNRRIPPPIPITAEIPAVRKEAIKRNRQIIQVDTYSYLIDRRDVIQERERR